jgi:hypothetical protein
MQTEYGVPVNAKIRTRPTVEPRNLTTTTIDTAITTATGIMDTSPRDERLAVQECSGTNEFVIASMEEEATVRRGGMQNGRDRLRSLVSGLEFDGGEDVRASECVLIAQSMPVGGGVQM